MADSTLLSLFMRNSEKCNIPPTPLAALCGIVFSNLKICLTGSYIRLGSHC